MPHETPVKAFILFILRCNTAVPQISLFLRQSIWDLIMLSWIGGYIECKTMTLQLLT